MRRPKSAWGGPRATPKVYKLTPMPGAFHTPNRLRSPLTESFTHQTDLDYHLQSPSHTSQASITPHRVLRTSARPRLPITESFTRQPDLDHPSQSPSHTKQTSITPYRVLQTPNRPRLPLTESFTHQPDQTSITPPMEPLTLQTDFDHPSQSPSHTKRHQPDTTDIFIHLPFFYHPSHSPSYTNQTLIRHCKHLHTAVRP